MTRGEHRAARALGDAFWGGVGQVGAMVAGLGAALLLPRVLGPSEYGDWVLLRGLMSFVVLFSVMGTPEIMARFHVSSLAAGRGDAAALVFKSVATLRMGLTVAAVFVFLVLAPGRIHPASGAAGLAWLVVGVVAQSAALTFLLLLYAHRGFARLALFNIVQPAVVPLLVVAAFRRFGFDAVPLAVAAGDIAMLALVLALSARHLRWPAGWPSADERRAILRFGGLVGLASLALGAYQSLAPFVMDLRGYAAEAVGYVGLSTRLSGLLTLFLAALGASLFPSFTHVLQSEGRDVLLRGYDLATRVGLALALCGVGATAIAAPAVVGPLFGAEYHDAATVVTIGMSATVPLWLGGQCSRLSWLLNRPRTHFVMTLALLAVSGISIVVLPVDIRGLSAALALALGAAAYALVGGWVLRDQLPRAAGLARSVPPMTVTLALALAAPWMEGDAVWRAGMLAAWIVVFAFVCLLSGIVTREEWRAFAKVVAAARRGGDREPPVEPPLA